MVIVQRELKFNKASANLINQINSFLSYQGVRAYLVGGVVRDALLGNDTHDIDIAVQGSAFGLGKLLADEFKGFFVALNEEHQVARIILEHQGSKWLIDVSSIQGTLEQDMYRRDFTVDSLAVEMVHLDDASQPIAIMDFSGGCKDISNKLIRAQNKRVFQADPVRLLRAVRLSVQLNFSIDTETQELIRKNCGLINIAAAERVREELCRIFMLQNTTGAIRVLDRLGILVRLFPEISSMKGVGQPKEHYWDVFDHSVETINAVEAVLRVSKRSYTKRVMVEIPWTPDIKAYMNQEVGPSLSRCGLLKFAALFHDIAKPETKTFSQDGRMHFFGHPKLGAEKIIAIMKRLRFSSKEVSLVEKLVEHHLRPGLINGQGEMPTKRALYRYYRDTHSVSVELLYLNLADYLAARGPLLQHDEWKNYSAKIRYILSAKQDESKSVSPPRLIDGHILMERLNLRPGPVVGELLEIVREAQAAGEISTIDEAIALSKRQLKGGAST